MCGTLWYSVRYSAWYSVVLCDTMGWQSGIVCGTVLCNRAMWWQSIALIHTMVNADVFELMTW